MINDNDFAILKRIVNSLSKKLIHILSGPVKKRYVRSDPDPQHYLQRQLNWLSKVTVHRIHRVWVSVPIMFALSLFQDSRDFRNFTLKEKLKEEKYEEARETMVEVGTASDTLSPTSKCQFCQF